MEKADIEYLFKRYYIYVQQRDALLEQIAKLEAKATKISPSFDANKAGAPPITNPKPSKVERYAIKIVEAQKKVDQLEQLIAAGDRLFKALRPHQRYLVRCVVCNGMKPEEFSKREGIAPATVRLNLSKIYKKLENV